MPITSGQTDAGAGVCTVEIERRWLMSAFPPEDGQTSLIGEVEKAQGYICTAPVVRIRSEQQSGSAAVQYVLCIKGRGTLAREEIETPLDRETFGRLCAFIGVPLVRKRTRLYRLDTGHTLECSLVDEGEPTSFFYAEVEFNTVEEARAFSAPAFLGPEKTEDPDFSMSAYWRKKCAAYAARKAAEETKQ